MGTVRYTVVEGEVLSENRNGVKRDYVPDPLGSTVALLDNTQTKTDTFTYWPYGEEASRTGTTATPFRYVGTQGYYRDSSSRTYVRARYLNTAQGRWMTQDPIGFRGRDWNVYNYSHNRPTVLVDYTGYLSIGSTCRSLGTARCIHARLQALQRMINSTCSSGILGFSDAQWKQIWACAKIRTGYSPPSGVTWSTFKKCMKSYCSGGFKIECYGPMSDPNGWCEPGTCAYNTCDMDKRDDPNNAANIVICADMAIPCSTCIVNPVCGCETDIARCGGSRGHEGVCLLLHEMVHGCGFCSGEDFDQEWADALACCIITRLYPRG